MRLISDHPSPGGSCRCAFTLLVLLMPLSGLVAARSFAQVVDNQQQTAAIETRLNQLTETLSQTQKVLEKSRAEIQELRSQVDALRAQTGAASISGASSLLPEEDYGHPQDLNALREQQDAMQAEIKQHEQTKVETLSKYPLRLSGLIVFNAFSNAGVVDNADLPTIAMPRIPGESHGSSGATLRQTLLTLDASGPRIAGARSSAEVSVDFFAGGSTNSYGYSSPGGLLRMRQTWASLDWYKTTARAGYTAPLFSPLSPTSYATIAVPALTGAGNLWTWSPQLQVEQRIPITEQHTVVLEAGFIDPPTSGYKSDQLNSPVEASRHPGYEGRVSYRANGSWKGVPQPFTLGVSGYSAHQLYNSATQIHSWAATADWQIPIFKRLGLSGEVYRGRSLGGFGGGAYKDIISGIDSLSGLTRTTGVATAGGWSQLKFIASSTLQANAAFGLDTAFSSNFQGFNLPPNTALPLNTKNNSVLGNVIYRPMSYLILSPEYRRIQTWPYDRAPSIANIFTITAGFEF